MYGLSISLIRNRTHNPQSKKQDYCELCQRTRQSIHYMHRSIKTDTTYKIQKKKNNTLPKNPVHPVKNTDCPS